MKKLTEKQIKKYRAEAAQTVHLADLQNIAHKLAEYNLKIFGYYFCILDGVKTEIVK